MPAQLIAAVSPPIADVAASIAAGNADFVCDIGLGKMCADLCSDGFAALCITVQKCDFCAERAKVTRGGFAEA
jgi:hypothetical protein